MVRHRKVLPNGAPSVGARRPCRSVPVSECWIYLYLTTQGNSDEGYSENQGAYLGINSKNMVSCTDETNEREQGGRKEGRVELVKEQGNYDSTTQERVAHKAALLISGGEPCNTVVLQARPQNQSCSFRNTITTFYYTFDTSVLPAQCCLNTN